MSALAFVAAFAVVIMEFTSVPSAQTRTRHGNAAIWIIAIVIFIELGLRTDSLLADWIPYHRSYWVGPADFVRAGGWLLWDVPAQYGFLSALSLAIWPAASTWQALYEQTALTLVFDGLILFWLLREQRSGPLNTTFTLLVTVATLFSSEGARSPFGWRLYPQAGLRFTGLIALMAVSYAIYKASKKNQQTRALYCLGFAVWISSVAWSFESGILATIFWAAFLGLDFLYELLSTRSTFRKIALSAGTHFLPFIFLPILFVGFVEAYYRLRLGHGPDWTGFFEFSFAFQSEQVELREIAATGPGWVLISILIGVGFEALRAVRLRLRSAPITCALWFGIWGISSYYVGEGFNNHINVLSPLLAIVVAIVIAVRRSEATAADPPLAVYSLFTPLFIICIAQAFANPVELLSIKAPLLPGYSFDSIAGFDKNGVEIKQLEREAGVKPTDRIIYPDSNWRVKLDLGLNMPFIDDGSGLTVQQVAWLPVSPVGPFDMLMTLPYERRALYLTRYFAQVHETGWLLSYHQPVDCKRYVPTLTTQNVYRSLNYEIARCVDPSVGGVATLSSH
jgi:hypothetical protein